MKGCKAWADRAHTVYEKINPTQHGNGNVNNITTGGNPPVRHVFKLGLDVDLNFAVTAIQ